MGIIHVDAPSTLLCGEGRNSSPGLGGVGDELAEVGSGIDFLGAADGAVFPVDTDEAVRELIEKEMDHQPQSGYAERLERGGLEASWRKHAMRWICKVHSYFGFGPLSLYLAVNYLDRFLSSYDLPHDKPWMQQLLSVACLSLAAKMEETVVPLLEDLQLNEMDVWQEDSDGKDFFRARDVGRMEIFVLRSLKWRMQAVTPFSFISYFLDKFNEGKPPSFAVASRCAKIIIATQKGPAFLSFSPSEIAAAVALAAVSGNQILGFEGVLEAFEIPINKEMVVRCYELMQGQVLVKRGHNGRLSVPPSLIAVLDAACFSFESDEASTLESSQSNNSTNKNNKASTPASKRRKLSMSPI